MNGKAPETALALRLSARGLSRIENLGAFGALRELRLDQLDLDQRVREVGEW
jgi:hypothetical protein